ncbi:hypothetical protein [Bacillus sp. V3B]
MHSRYKRSFQDLLIQER